MHRVMIVGAQPRLHALIASLLAGDCVVTAAVDRAGAEAALRRGDLHAVIIDMELLGADSVALARDAASRGCGTILIPELPAQFNAAAATGHLILCKPPRRERLLEMIEEACAGRARRPSRQAQR